MPACWIQRNASYNSEPPVHRTAANRFHCTVAGAPHPATFFSTMPTTPERPDTPCVAVCSTTFDDICRGCGRTVVEVAEWVFMSDDDKEKVWQRITAQGYPRRNT